MLPAARVLFTDQASFGSSETTLEALRPVFIFFGMLEIRRESSSGSSELSAESISTNFQKNKNPCSRAVELRDEAASSQSTFSKYHTFLRDPLSGARNIDNFNQSMENFKQQYNILNPDEFEGSVLHRMIKAEEALQKLRDFSIKHKVSKELEDIIEALAEGLDLFGDLSDVEVKYCIDHDIIEKISSSECKLG